jgi:hypothetical protein
MAKKLRVWTEQDIREAFDEYLLDYYVSYTERWRWLSPDEWAALSDYHFEIFVRELKREEH